MCSSLDGICAYLISIANVWSGKDVKLFVFPWKCVRLGGLCLCAIGIAII